jgi:shikimate kinase
MSAARRVLYLVGLRGSGKSTVGRLLAERLKIPFHDADAVLEARAGRSIRDIFAAEGEASFRDLEEQALRDLSDLGPAVVATGGGVILREANRERMRASGMLVWLTADIDTMLARMERDPHTADRRPALVAGGRDEIEELLRQRTPLYHACADLTIDTARRSPEAVVHDILASCSISSWITACSSSSS